MYFLFLPKKIFYRIEKVNIEIIFCRKLCEKGKKMYGVNAHINSQAPINFECLSL